MTRTPEQIEADNALTDAIEAVHRAYDDDIEGVLTKYVVLAQRQWWDDDGDSITASYSSPRDLGVPVSDLLGMVEYASTRFRAEIARDDD